MRVDTHLKGVHHTSKKDILLFVTCTVNSDTINLRNPCSAYTLGGCFKRSYKLSIGYEPRIIRVLGTYLRHQVSPGFHR